MRRKMGGLGGGGGNLEGGGCAWERSGLVSGHIGECVGEHERRAAKNKLQK